MEGSLDFLLFHTDLKSEESSVIEDSAGDEIVLGKKISNNNSTELIVDQIENYIV